MQLTLSQTKIVEKLFNAFKKRKIYKFASFKAPTGSGKTFMASEFISRALASQLTFSQKTVFIVATISNADLPRQFARKLEQYKKFHIFQDYKIEHIESPSKKKTNKIEDIPQFVPEDNKVFVFGTSSFGKNTLFYQNKTLDVFLQQAEQLKYQIFFIRDEAHIGKKETISQSDLKTFDQKMYDHSNFVIEMTATPKTPRNLIEMTIDDMNEDGYYLLKTSMKKTKLENEITNEKIIDDAIDTFKKSKKEYQKITSSVINPAMLIQVMNETDYKKDPVKNQQFKEGLELLENKLQKAGLKYLKYLNNTPQVVGTKVPNTLEYASEIDAEIDAIIFKIGPATGWDIPRANMLLQIRSVSSETLNLQTLGRIMRNPYPNLKRHHITDKYYVWSNYQKPTRELTSYQLKNKFLNENFIWGFINRKSILVKSDEQLYKEKVVNFVNSSGFINKIKDLDFKNDIIYDQISYGSAFVKNKIPNHIYLKIDNLKKLAKYESDLQISYFFDKLKNVAKELKVNLEIIKYVFFLFAYKLKEIKSQSMKWFNKKEPYKINDTAKTLKYYQLWKDNDNPKKISTADFVNYGYLQIATDQNIQYLDSTPELKFFEKFKTVIHPKQRKKIDFFAKMPTLGSSIFFEYYSQLQGRIAKSFMDFAIKYKDKIIMVEVKAKDEDYNPEKTQELLQAYRIYMEKFHYQKIALVLYQYGKEGDGIYNLYGYINNKWCKGIEFRELFDELLK